MEVKKLKKFKQIGYIILIVIIVVLSLTIYTNASKNNEQNSKDKTLSEIKFLESKLVNLLNTMNNIESRNYKVSYGEISEQSSKGNSGGSSSKGSSEGNSQEESSGGSDSSSSQESSSGGQDSSSQKEDTKETEKKYELKINGVLNNSEDINWDIVKSEIENLYTSIPTITIDLYNMNLNQEDILNFNKEYDALALVAKDENKEDTLKQLSKLYEYIPKFISNVTDKELSKVLMEAKSNVFKAYSKLDKKDWKQISSDIKDAINSYSKLLTSTNIDANKQYSINRGYIILNELQNAVSVQDESIFLIKYKNLIEQLENI